MTTRNKWLVPVLGLVLTLALAGAALAADAVAGRWKHPDGTVMEFSGDGTLLIKAKPEAEAARMYYTIEGNNILTLVREDNTTMSMRFRVSGDKKRLTLTSLDVDAGEKVQPEVLQRLDPEPARK